MPEVLLLSRDSPESQLLWGKVSTLLNFAESGNKCLKIGKLTKSSKKL